MAKFCGKCGSKLENEKCPKCDKEVVTAEKVETKSTNDETKTNALAITGFVLSLVSFIFTILAIPGLILSIVGLNQIKANKEEGKGLAIAGIVISSVVIGLVVIGLIIIFAGFVSLANYYY